MYDPLTANIKIGGEGGNANLTPSGAGLCGADPKSPGVWVSVARGTNLKRKLTCLNQTGESFSLDSNFVVLFTPSAQMWRKRRGYDKGYRGIRAR